MMIALESLFRGAKWFVECSFALARMPEKLNLDVS
jgi:hypothetical protein